LEGYLQRNFPYGVGGAQNDDHVPPEPKASIAFDEPTHLFLLTFALKLKFVNSLVLKLKYQIAPTDESLRIFCV
jgi:hypothetical protein